MTDKKKITLIYVGVAFICALVLGMSFLLLGLRKVNKEGRASPRPELVKKMWET
jgi:CHASE3 domain sensor protein